MRRRWSSTSRSARCLEAADLVICIGYDRVEYPPELCNPNGDKVIMPVDALQAEVDQHYNVRCGGPGDTGEALAKIAEQVTPRPDLAFTALREAIVAERDAHAGDTGFPLRPQKILWDLRQALAPEDIVVCDVGAHKM